LIKEFLRPRKNLKGGPVLPVLEKERTLPLLKTRNLSGYFLKEEKK